MKKCVIIHICWSEYFICYLVNIACKFSTLKTSHFVRIKVFNKYFFFRGNKIASIILSIVVITINTYFVVNTVNEHNLHWFFLLVIIIVGIFYLLFCFYLVVHMAISMGNTSLLRYHFVNKYIMGPVDMTLNIEPISYTR